MAKNLCGKTVKEADAYEVWEGNGWVYKVLKKYLSDEAEAKNPYSRYFCKVYSPFVPDGELGDVYVKDIKSHCRKVK